MVAFLSGAVLTAANLNSAFNALTFRAVTATSDTFVLADNGGAVNYSNASPITATVPPFSSVAYANGTTIQLLNLGAGVVTVTAGVGVTLNGASVAIAQNTGGTLIKTATNTWYFLPSASAGAGMDLITPTSVAGSGVTLSGGKVSFSAATSISLNGCFSAAYDAYALVFKATAASGAPRITVRMRTAGTDNTTSNYGDQYLAGSGVTASAGRVSAATFMTVGIVHTTASTLFINLMDPFSASVTTGTAQNHLQTSTVEIYEWAFVHNVATSFDGLTIVPNASNITGQVVVYGLKAS